MSIKWISRTAQCIVGSKLVDFPYADGEGGNCNAWIRHYKHNTFIVSICVMLADGTEVRIDTKNSKKTIGTIKEGQDLAEHYIKQIMAQLQEDK